MAKANAGGLERFDKDVMDLRSDGNSYSRSAAILTKAYDRTVTVLEVRQAIWRQLTVERKKADRKSQQEHDFRSFSDFTVDWDRKIVTCLVCRVAKLKDIVFSVKKEEDERRAKDFSVIVEVIRQHNHEVHPQ